MRTAILGLSHCARHPCCYKKCETRFQASFQSRANAGVFASSNRATISKERNGTTDVEMALAKHWQMPSFMEITRICTRRFVFVARAMQNAECSLSSKTRGKDSTHRRFPSPLASQSILSEHRGIYLSFVYGTKCNSRKGARKSACARIR